MTQPQKVVCSSFGEIKQSLVSGASLTLSSYGISKVKSCDFSPLLEINFTSGSRFAQAESNCPILTQLVPSELETELCWQSLSTVSFSLPISRMIVGQKAALIIKSGHPCVLHMNTVLRKMLTIITYLFHKIIEQVLCTRHCARCQDTHWQVKLPGIFVFKTLFSMPPEEEYMCNGCKFPSEKLQRACSGVLDCRGLVKGIRRKPEWYLTFVSGNVAIK